MILFTRCRSLSHLQELLSKEQGVKFFAAQQKEIETNAAIANVSAETSTTYSQISLAAKGESYSIWTISLCKQELYLQ